MIIHVVSNRFAAIPIRISYLADFATGVVAGVVVALALGFYYVFYRYRRYGQCYRRYDQCYCKFDQC